MTHRLEGPGDFYTDRPGDHTAQGDIYDGVPFVYAAAVASVQPQGGRKRPGAPPTEDHPSWVEMTHPTYATGIVCSYTCSFVAQPPGTQGYSHEWRLVAPVMPLGPLVRARVGLTKNEARKLVDHGLISGLMYLPPLPGTEPETEDGEFGGSLVALLFRAASVSQALLDARGRVARLSLAAQRRLCVGLIQTVSPWFFDEADNITLHDPDQTDSWAPRGDHATSVPFPGGPNS